MVRLPCRDPTRASLLGLVTPACLSSFHANLGKPWGFQWHPAKCHHALLTARHMIRASDVVVGCCLGQQCRGGMQTAETGLPLCHGLTSLFHCSSLFLLSRLFTYVEVLCADPVSGPVQRAVKMIADRWRMKQEGCSPPRQSDRTGQPGWDRTEMEASYTSSRPIRCVVLLHPMWKVKGRYILATVQKA